MLKEKIKKDKVLILKESFYFKPGQVIEGFLTEKGLFINDKLINKKQYIQLNESLSKQDEEKVREICREILVKMFYKMYVQSPIIIR